MDCAVIKDKEKIDIYIDNKKIKKNKDFCFLLGNIYNINEEDILPLYYKHGEEIFNELNGEYALILVVDNKIIFVRDRLGSKQIFYSKVGSKYIVSTSLKIFTKLTKKIDKQELSNYLCYRYINENKTILKNVYKLNAGSYIKIDNEIEFYQYYDLLTEYKKNKNRINNQKKSIEILTNSLKESIRLRIKDKNKIGIFFSSGIDSTLLASLCKELTNEVHTYTVGFYEQERNEAVEAKNIAKYIKTIHHEFYLDHESVKKIIRDIPKIYSEPLADPSLIPIIFLNQKAQNMDIILTGDGADQMYCGSNVYDQLSLYPVFYRKDLNWYMKIRRLAKFLFSKNDCFKNKKKVTVSYFDIPPQDYYKLSNINGKIQIRYMLLDIKCFLSNCLFSKVSFPANYYNISISHPFIDNNVVKNTLKINHKYKYNKKEKKYILKKILFNRIPEELFAKKKKGFGIPLKKWLNEVFYDDIIKYLDLEVLIKQNLFPVKKMKKCINKFKNNDLNDNECFFIFSCYMFELWYQEYIENLW